MIYSSYSIAFLITVCLLSVKVAVAANYGFYYYNAKTLQRDCNQFMDTMKNGANKSLDANDIGHGMRSGSCIGFIQGVIGAYEILHSPQIYQDSLQSKICIPKEWTFKQGINIFLSWATAHPDVLYIPAEAAVLQSQLGAFPCKSTPPTN